MGRLFKFHLPMRASEGLAAVFEALEGARRSGATPITDYAVSQPTLEQIFVAVATESGGVGGDNAGSLDVDVV